MDPDKTPESKNWAVYVVIAIVAIVFLLFWIMTKNDVKIEPTQEKKTDLQASPPLQGQATGAVVAQGSCTDSDGENTFVAGETSLGDKDVKDSCHGNKVIEFICGKKEGNDAIIQKLLKCPGACNNGACVPTCGETDNGIDIKTRSIVYGGNERGLIGAIERCKDTHTLMEYFCSGSEIVERDIACTCKEGSCV